MSVVYVGAAMIEYGDAYCQECKIQYTDRSDADAGDCRSPRPQCHQGGGVRPRDMSVEPPPFVPDTPAPKEVMLDTE